MEMRDLIKKWRAAGAEWNPVSPVGSAYAECAWDLDVALNEQERQCAESSIDGFPSDTTGKPISGSEVSDGVDQ